MKKREKVALAVLSLMMVYMSLGIRPIVAASNAEASEIAQQNIVEVIREKATKEIDKRISSLNKLIDKVNQMKWLLAEQKSGLVTDINKNIESLKTLRSKIMTDTDVVTLRADRKSIAEAYRIFAVFEPRVNILARANSVIVKIEVLRDKTDKVEVFQKLDQAKNEANGAITTVTPLVPEGYPGNLSLLKIAKQQLRKSEELYKEARKMVGKNNS